MKKFLRGDRRWALALLVFLAAAGVLLVQRVSLEPGLDPLPQDPDIQVYFNYNQAKGAQYRDPYRQIQRPGDNLEATILSTIDQAQSSIDLAVQELRLPQVAQALVKKHQKGIKVRLVLENQYNFSVAEKTNASTSDDDRLGDYQAFIDRDHNGTISPEEAGQWDAIEILRRGGVPLIDDTEDGSKGSGLMHHKFLLVDQKTVLVTSANFTLSDQHGDYGRPETRGNANNLLVMQSPELARLFREEFDLLWGDGPGGSADSQFGVQKKRRSPAVISLGNSRITLKFSPDSRKVAWEDTGNGLIARFLGTAQKSVDLALFVFSEQPLADVLQQPFQRGVEIKTLIDPGFAFRSYSEGLDLMGVTLLEKCRVEANNNPWPKPVTFVGLPALAEGDKLHHKLGLIDGRIVITGSHNWSPTANYQNDETLLIIENNVIGAHYQREMARLQADAQWGLPGWLQGRIAKESKACAQGTQTDSKPLPVATTSGLVNLNTASQAELETLPGIGPGLAKRIISARETQPFTAIDDLRRVDGIKAGKLNKLQGRVSW